MSIEQRIERLERELGVNVPADSRQDHKDALVKKLVDMYVRMRDTGSEPDSPMAWFAMYVCDSQRRDDWHKKALSSAHGVEYRRIFEVLGWDLNAE